MKHSIFLPIFFVSVVSFAQSWKPVEGKIATQWASKVDPSNVHSEYPRPQMEREGWLSLNGLWDYAIHSAQAKPTTYAGKILVPFAVESSLSGVGKNVAKDNLLWYRRTFNLPSAFRKQNVLLHFGAVDWRCEVFVNGKSAGKHEGGYDPFFFDITSLLQKSAAQEIIVSVWDPSDEGPQPRGKQVKAPQSIWYTPVTGIWQTVWIETAPSSRIESIAPVSDIDKQRINFTTSVINWQEGDQIVMQVFDGNAKIATHTATSQAFSLSLPNAKHWSPNSPTLYRTIVQLQRRGKVIDQVKSYFAMRKISMLPDKNGVQRMMLNNEFVFQYGPLDQGWWPDGLYTAPSDEALQFDILKTKEMGFNMIRKHVKVEPARWYYHCDRLGMLVWQDMPSGDMGNQWESRPGIVGIATEKQRTTESEEIFRKEWKAIIDATKFFQSIVVWVPFNEAWGQFNTEEIVKWTMAYDSSRLVNAASGGNFTKAGHIIDLHNYPAPCMPDPALFGKDQIIVLGEYGGLGLPVEGHTWQSKDNWGYQSFKDKEALLEKYTNFVSQIPDLIRLGLSAAVYTQTTDVEIEVNGLMTYDRKVVKMPESTLSTIHQKLYVPIIAR
jgi:beta-galactosidase/beta-glucuronidase